MWLNHLFFHLLPWVDCHSNIYLSLLIKEAVRQLYLETQFFICSQKCPILKTPREACICPYWFLQLLFTICLHLLLPFDHSNTCRAKAKDQKKWGGGGQVATFLSTISQRVTGISWIFCQNQEGVDKDNRRLSWVIRKAEQTCLRFLHGKQRSERSNVKERNKVSGCQEWSSMDNT